MWTVRQGQSIYDVCLQTYGSLDLLFVMMAENGISSLSENLVGKKITDKVKLNFVYISL